MCLSDLARKKDPELLLCVKATRCFQSELGKNEIWIDLKWYITEF